MVHVYIEVGGKRTFIPGSPFKDLATAHYNLRRHCADSTTGVPWKWLVEKHDAYGFIIHGTLNVKNDIIIHVPTK